MKIKLSHIIGVVTITTDHNDPDEIVYPQISVESGNNKIQKHIEERLRAEINRGSGFYGHTMDFDNTTNLDLSAAVTSLSSFEVISIEPKITPNPLPDGVKT